MNAEHAGAGDRLHVRPDRADVGPDRVDPRRGRLGDLRRLGVDDLVAGVGQPVGGAVDPGPHVRVDPGAERVADDGDPDRPVDGRPVAAAPAPSAGRGRRGR